MMLSFAIVGPLWTQEVEDLVVLTWNVESRGSSATVVATQLATHARGASIVALQEVEEQDAPLYRAALGQGWESVVGTTGRSMRQLLLFDARRLELIGYRELLSYDGVPLIADSTRSGLRAPILAEFVDRSGGYRFGVVAVHFTRGDEAQRLLEAYLVRRLLEESGISLVALGDFNFDLEFNPDTGAVIGGNTSWVAFTAGTGVLWIEPQVLVDTQWSDANGSDRYPESILDFVFVNGCNWTGSAEIVVLPEDFPDTGETSDHRPVRAQLTPDPLSCRDTR